MSRFWKMPLEFVHEWEWWNVYPHHALFEWFLASAKVVDCRVMGIKVRRGSLLTTWNEMQRAVSNKQRTCTRGTLSRALADLSDSGEITLKTDCRQTIVTICKYESYCGRGETLWTDGGLIADRRRTDTPIINKNIEYENNIYSAHDDDGFVTEDDCRAWMRRYNDIARSFGVSEKNLAQQLSDTRRQKISRCVRERGRGTVDAMFERLEESSGFFADGSRGFRGDFTKLWSPSVFDMVLEGSFVPVAKKAKPQQKTESAGLFESVEAGVPERESSDEYRRKMREYAKEHPESSAAKIVAQWDEGEQEQETDNK